MIFIIADDLTGATDSGVQFSKQGYNTFVSAVLNIELWKLPDLASLANTVDVFVVDTETREVDSNIARSRIRQIINSLPIGQDDIIYKKIDSTMRGNIGVEIDECLKLLNKDLCLLTPSFPTNHRITSGGYLRVNEQLLGHSEYYSGSLEPNEASYIPYLLAQETDRHIAHISINDIVNGSSAISKCLQEHFAADSQVIVADSTNEEQLLCLIHGSFEFEGSILYSGSAGFANSLASAYKGEKRQKLNFPIPIKPVVIVSGSRRTIVRQQIEFLKKKINFIEQRVNVEQILSDRDHYIEQFASKVSQTIQNGHHVVIHPDPNDQKKLRLQFLLSEYQLDFRELGIIIRDFLSDSISKINKIAQIYNLLINGGDTAAGICSALQIDQFYILEEILPGVPRMVSHQRNDTLNIITKAGGFGDEQILFEMVNNLVN